MWARAARQAAAIVAIGVALGAAANLVAPWRIPWIARPHLLAAAPDSLFAGTDRHPADTGRVAEPLSITLAQAKALFDQNGAVFVDARPAYEYSAGHIPGATNIPWEEVEYYEKQIASLSKDGTIVVYCAGESCDLSIHLGHELARRGFARVRVFFGGWIEWAKAGYRQER